MDCLNNGEHYFVVILHYTPIFGVPLDPNDYGFNLKGRLFYFFRRSVSDTYNGNFFLFRLVVAEYDPVFTYSSGRVFFKRFKVGS